MDTYIGTHLPYKIKFIPLFAPRVKNRESLLICAQTWDEDKNCRPPAVLNCNDNLENEHTHIGTHRNYLIVLRWSVLVKRQAECAEDSRKKNVTYGCD